MVKQNKTKKQLRNEAEWQDIRIKRNTIKSLGFLKLNLDMNTYDDVVQYLLTKEGSQ
jgi:hypothetical protein